MSDRVHDATSHIPPSMFTGKRKAVAAAILAPLLVGSVAYGVHKAKERKEGRAGEKTAGIAGPMTEDDIRRSFSGKEAGFRERFQDFLEHDPNNRKLKALLYGGGAVAGAGMGAVGGLADNALNPSRTEEERRRAMILNTVLGGVGGAGGSHLAIMQAGL